MYSLRYSSNAKKSLKNLDPQMGRRIYQALDSIRADPRSHIKEMRRPKGSEPLYKYRIGDYRIIMTLFDEELVVLVVDIEPMKNDIQKIWWEGVRVTIWDLYELIFLKTLNNQRY